MSKKKKTSVAPRPVLSAPPKTPSSAPRYFLFCLVLISFLVLLPTLRNGFVNFDDPQYVTENPVIRTLDPSTLRTVFTTAFVGNYQPLTMLSYALEYHFFKLDPFIYHLVNLILHLLNTVLVFYIALKLLDHNPVPAFITAFLFSVHPMHVESVAWVSERKDVLYGLFFLTSLYCYLQHTKAGEKTGKYYWLSLFFFVLSLFSKAQAVVLPVVLMITDYFLQRTWTRKLFLEKLPFFLFAIGFGLLAVWIQETAGAVQDYAFFRFYERLLFSSYALVNYFVKILVPLKLSCFYPYPETGGKINSIWVYWSPVILLLAGFCCIRFLRHSRVFIFGILFFLATIVLLLQLIPVGDAIIADRYTYLPSLGLFFAGAHYAEGVRSNRYPRLQKYRSFILAGVALYLLALAVMSFNRSRVWKDSITLYSDALKKYPAAIIYNNRGVAYSDKKQYQQAIADFTHVVTLNPRFPNGYKNRAASYERLGDTLQAISDYAQAELHFPRDEKIYIQRGNLYKALGKLDLAIRDYTEVAELVPGNPDVYLTRAELYGRSGKYREALADIDRALVLDPNLATAYNNRGIVNGFSGHPEKAVADFSRAIQLDPGLGNAYLNRSIANKSTGNYAAALEDALTAKKLGYAVDDNYLNELNSAAGSRQVK